MRTAEYWIGRLKLQSHPEGGFFSETYRSDELISPEELPDRYKSGRCYSTAIYFMVTKESPSKFHRVNSDEIWHYHYGGSASIVMINSKGIIERLNFGSNPDNEENFQILIPKNTWFAAHIIAGDYVVLSCTVAPGFDFSDFELASREILIDEFPFHKKEIIEFT